MKMEEIMTKVQKWFAKLRNRIFFSFVGCFLGIMLLIMGVFQFSSQKYFSQLAVSSTRRELASITDNLESTLQHVIISAYQHRSMMKLSVSPERIQHCRDLKQNNMLSAKKSIPLLMPLLP